jgi:hypothetical protein
MIKQLSSLIKKASYTCRFFKAIKAEALLARGAAFLRNVNDSKFMHGYSQCEFVNRSVLRDLPDGKLVLRHFA